MSKSFLVLFFKKEHSSFLGFPTKRPLAAAAAAAFLMAATLRVGPNEPYTTVSAGVAAAQNGDTVLVDAGTYVNDFPVVATPITLRANGGRVMMQATEDIPNQQAILVVQADANVDGFTFKGAHVSARAGSNGAGIRYISGNLRLSNCWFTHNQDGLFANPSANGTITIKTSQFDHNGDRKGPESGHTHNLYVDAIAKLVVDQSYFAEAIEGHEIKSRALVTVIENSRLVDGAGTASYSIDLPNGGRATLSHLQIEQGPNSANPILIAYGEEGSLPENSRLLLRHTLLENDLTTKPPLGVWNASQSPVTLAGLRVYGLTADELVEGPATIRNVKYLTSEPRISRRHPF